MGDWGEKRNDKMSPFLSGDTTTTTNYFSFCVLGFRGLSFSSQMGARLSSEKERVFDLKNSSQSIKDIRFDKKGNLTVTFPCGPAALYFSPLFSNEVLFVFF